MLIFVCREKARVSTSRNPIMQGVGFRPNGMLILFSLWLCGCTPGPGAPLRHLGWGLSKAAIMKGSHSENKGPELI